MTTITTYPMRDKSLGAPLLRVVGALSAVASLPASALSRWRSYRELRTLESLPEGLLKDIGWPSGDSVR